MYTSEVANRMIELEDQGLRYIRERKYLEAIEIFNKIINEDPSYEHGNIYYDLGVCYEDIGKFDRAEECYKKALEYEPNDIIKLGGLGSLYFIQKRYNEALDIYIHLFELKSIYGFTDQIKTTITGIKELKKLLNWNDNTFKDYLIRKGKEKILDQLIEELEFRSN